MITPGEAECLMRSHLLLWPAEDCPLEKCQGRILRQSLHADRELPPFDRVMLDGYALRSDAISKCDQGFRVTGIVAAGAPPACLPDEVDACIEVMTGAVLPGGADCVVPYERTQRFGDRMRLEPTEAETRTYGPRHGVHRRGSDHKAGALLVRGGIRLSGREMAVAAACGYAALSVARQPRIALLTTGDELVAVGETPEPWQLRRSNDLALEAALQASGFRRTTRHHARDDRQELLASLGALLSANEVVLVTGGVSLGKYDFIPSLLAELGVEQVFHGVAQRPGKPLYFGIQKNGTLVFGLPGNPVSAFTCLHRYVLPALEQAIGLPPEEPALLSLERAFPRDACFTSYIPARRMAGADGTLHAVPMPANTSGDFSRLVDTDGFLEVAAGTGELPAGTLVPFCPWT
jgi:molybdopterin molybdotransferase